MNLDLQDSNDEPADFDEPANSQLDEPEHVDRHAHRPAPPVDALREIIAKHRADFDRRDFDYSLRGEPVKLARGSREHVRAFARRPQWHGHLASAGRRRRTTYLDLIRSEAAAAFGRDGAAAVEALL